jgi:predicted TIM-barrel fold metal-dependent hydrolase
MTRQLVDIHPHIISADVEKYPITPLGGVRSEWSKDRHAAPLEALLEAMDSANVARAAVVQSSTTYGHNNSYLADSVDRSDGRITGVCSVGFMDDSVIDDIKYWIDERGMSGLRLFTTGSTMQQTDWLNDQKAMVAWDYVAERDIPICVQLRVPALPMLHDVLRRHPNLRIVLDHVVMTEFLEGPPYAMAEPIWELADYPGVHLKVTTKTLRTGGQSEGGAVGVLRELIAHFGSERLAWGSNWPASDPVLGNLTSLLLNAVADLPERDAANICGETAMRLYPKLAFSSATASRS